MPGTTGYRRWSQIPLKRSTGFYAYLYLKLLNPPEVSISENSPAKMDCKVIDKMDCYALAWQGTCTPGTSTRILGCPARTCFLESFLGIRDFRVSLAVPIKGGANDWWERKALRVLVTFIL